MFSILLLECLTYDSEPVRNNANVRTLSSLWRTRTSIFYGWYMVVGLAIISLISVNLGGITFGFFIRPMQAELDINEAYFGWAISIRMVGFGVTSVIIGRLIDRHGARPLLIAVGIAVTGLIVALGFIQAGWQLLVIYTVIGLIGMQGSGGNLYVGVPIARWFHRNRGKAMSMVFMGIPAGIFLTPIITLLINNIGWRNTFVVTGISGGIAIVLVAVFIIRRFPEDMGLVPDGDVPSFSDVAAQSKSEKPRRSEVSLTRDQAMRSSAFWRLVLVYGFLYLAMSSVALFRIPYFEDQGISRQVIGFAFSAEAVASVVAAIPAGWALDRFRVQYVATVPIVILVGATLVTMAASNTWQVFVATCLFGVGAASSAVSQNVIWPHYFGSIHIGAIRGRGMQVIMLFNILGAPLTGVIKDATGSYLLAWWGAIAGLLLSAIILVFTIRPEVSSSRETDTHLPVLPA